MLRIPPTDYTTGRLFRSFMQSDRIVRVITAPDLSWSLLRTSWSVTSSWVYSWVWSDPIGRYGVPRCWSCHEDACHPSADDEVTPRLLSKTYAVGAQCFDSSDLRTPAIRPCFRSSDIVALVTPPSAYLIQAGGHDPLGSARQRSRIPWTVHAAVWCSQSIIHGDLHQSSSHPASSSLDCLCKGVSGVQTSSVEQFAGWHYAHRQAESLSSSSNK